MRCRWGEKVPPRQYAQASSLNTVIRFVFTSLGIAVLATLVQSRAATHISTLAHQFKPISPAALAQIGKLGLNLAVQDAFWLTLVTFVLAFLVVCFIRVPKPVQQEQTATAEPAVQREAGEGSGGNRKEAG